MRLDSTAIDRIVRLGGDGLLHDLIGLFFEHGGRQFDLLMKGMDSNDLSAVEAAAHSLVSSAGTLGALELAAAARELETSARARDAEAVRAQRESIDRLFNTAKEALQARRESISQSPPES